MISITTKKFTGILIYNKFLFPRYLGVIC